MPGWRKGDYETEDIPDSSTVEAVSFAFPVNKQQVEKIIGESSDFFAKNRPLPKVSEGDYLALMSAGAYGFVMASNYNTRSLAAEVLVHGRQAAVVRGRQKLPDVWKDEKLPAWLK